MDTTDNRSGSDAIVMVAAMRSHSPADKSSASEDEGIRSPVYAPSSAQVHMTSSGTAAAHYCPQPVWAPQIILQQQQQQQQQKQQQQQQVPMRVCFIRPSDCQPYRTGLRQSDATYSPETVCSPTSEGIDDYNEDKDTIGEPPPLEKIKESSSEDGKCSSPEYLRSQEDSYDPPRTATASNQQYITILSPPVGFGSIPVAPGMGPRIVHLPNSGLPHQHAKSACATAAGNAMPLQAKPVVGGPSYIMPIPVYNPRCTPVVTSPVQPFTSRTADWTGAEPSSHGSTPIPRYLPAPIPYTQPAAQRILAATAETPEFEHQDPSSVFARERESRGTLSLSSGTKSSPFGRPYDPARPVYHNSSHSDTSSSSKPEIETAEHSNTKYYLSKDDKLGTMGGDQQPSSVPYYRLQGPYTINDGMPDEKAIELQDHVLRDPARITAFNGSEHDVQNSQSQVLYWCNQCHFTFKWRRHLEHHFMSHRTVARPNLCHLCGRCFTRGDHLNRHASMHFLQKLTCQLCGETFQRASHLEMHWTTNHSNYLANIRLPAPQKSLSATGRLSKSPTHQSEPQCKSACEQGHELASPEDDHTEGSLCTDEELTTVEQTALRMATAPLASSDSRPYRCSICARAFSRLAHLQRHQNVHVGDKPYRCSLCGRTFLFADKLKAHVIMTHDSHLISCSTCKKEFSTMGALTNHQKVHIREQINSAAAN